MGRKPSDNKRVQLMGRVPPALKAALEEVAAKEHRSTSQMLEIVLYESPRLKGKIRENGHKKAGK